MSRREESQMDREMAKYLITQLSAVSSPKERAQLKADLLRVAMDFTSNIEVAIIHVERRFKEAEPRASAKQQAELRHEHERGKKKAEPRAPKERKVRIQKAKSHTPVNGRRDHGHANGRLPSGHSIFHESGFE